MTETSPEGLTLEEIKEKYPPQRQDLLNSKNEVYASAVVSRDENQVIRYVEPMTMIPVGSEEIVVKEEKE